MKRRQKLWLIVSTCVLAGGLLAFGEPVWRLHRLARQIEQTIAALETGKDAEIRKEFLADLARYPEYQSEFQLFRGAYLLRIGFPEATAGCLAPLRPEGRIREALLMVSAEASVKMRQLPEAEFALRQVLYSSPQNSRAHRMLATTYYEMGNIPAAFAELKQVAELEPDDFYAYRLMGRLNLLDFQEHKAAAECYRKALVRNPPQSQQQALRIELAQALVNLNDYSEAIEFLDAAEPDATMLALTAGARWELGQRDEAEQCLRRAIALDPAEPLALLLTAKISLEDGKPAQALEPLRHLLERDPHNYSVRYQLSRAYQGLGDTAAAAAELDRVNASRDMLGKLKKLYEQTMERTRDPVVREELAELCDKLDRQELAQLWRRSAEYCRRNAELMGEPQ